MCKTKMQEVRFGADDDDFLLKFGIILKFWNYYKCEATNDCLFWILGLKQFSKYIGNDLLQNSPQTWCWTNSLQKV